MSLKQLTLQGLPMLSNIKIPARLTLMVSLFVAPLAFAVYLFINTINFNINFSVQETKGDEYLRPLISSMGHVNNLMIAGKSGDSKLSEESISKIEAEFKNIEAAQAHVGEDLQFTEDGLKSRGREALHPDVVSKKWAALADAAKAGKATDADFISLIADIKGMSAHAGDTSNLILDPDLDSYYLMDVVLLALPQTISRYTTALTEVTPIVEAGAGTSEELVKVAVHSAMFSESDIARIVADFDTVFKEDPNFYGESKTLKANIQPKLEAYVAANNELVETLKSISQDPTSVSKAKLLETTLAAQNSAIELWNASTDELDALLNTRIASLKSDKYSNLIKFAVILVFASIVFLVVARSIKNPLKALQNSMVKLANGELETEVPCTRHKDEIGAMANTVQVFKETSIKARELADAQRKKYELELKQKENLDKLIKEFEAKASALLSRVSEASADMSEMAETMVEVAEETTKNTKQTLGVTSEANNNVSAVAAAVEELSSAINEISSQLANSSTLSTEAVNKSRVTDTTVGKLSESADKINEIVSLIGGIANQINLLSLNATIESARAGEAGKGFAVVASEVKNLANQASEATDTISKQVSDIQEVVRDVVTSLNSVRKAIEENNKVSTAISAAVEEQGTASREIAMNVQQASTRVLQVSEKVSDVSQMAISANDNSKNVLQTAHKFASETDALKSEVEKFLEGIRNNQ